MGTSKLTTLHDDAGLPLKATFVVETSSDEVSVVVESRGGTLGAPNERNYQYTDGLDLLLRRLAEQGCILTDAVVDSRTTERMNLTREERRLIGIEYPMELRRADLVELRRTLCAAQRPIGRKPGASGSGNNTKRMRLYLRGLESDASTVAHHLSVPAHTQLAKETVQVASPSRHGKRQGRALSALERREIELHAMRIVRDHLERDWPEVADVSATDSCDFVCRSRTRQLFVEVKGTTGTGEVVIVTKNEVSLAKEHWPDTLLAIVSEIELDPRLTPPVAQGGRLSLITPWLPSDDSLEAIAYYHEVEKE